jgi:hypothetical protein
LNDYLMQILVAVVSGVALAAALGFFAWLRKSYAKFCEMSQSLTEISEHIGQVKNVMEKHEGRLDEHGRKLEEHGKLLDYHSSRLGRLEGQS